MLDILNSKIGLHQTVEIHYYVDCYGAQYYTTDGKRIVAEAEGATVLEALQNLEQKIKDFDIKHR